MINCFSVWQVLNGRVLWGGSRSAGCSWPAVCYCSGPASVLPQQSTAASCLSQSMGWHFPTGNYQKDSCWCLLELPIFKVALGSCRVQYVCSLAFYLYFPTWTEREVCVETCSSLLEPLFLPLTCLHIKENPLHALNETGRGVNKAKGGLRNTNERMNASSKWRYLLYFPVLWGKG